MPKISKDRAERLTRPHNQPIGFEKLMKIECLMSNKRFGEFLDECEDKNTVQLKVCQSGVIFRSGSLKIHLPMDTCLVEFPTCRGCGSHYLGHHKTFCDMCAPRAKKK